MGGVIAWPSLTLQNLDRKLNSLAKLVEYPAPEEPDQVTQALARFLVVRTCGHLEKTVQECFQVYIEHKSFGRVRLFSRSWTARINNPEPERLIEMVGRFGPELQRDLRELFENNDSELKREISLLINKRNLIAHGESEGVGSRKALDLLNYSQLLTDWFILNFDPR
ncbi:HEPN domain-containing protein [Acrocarpospora catenulata]|uniref:HEPN domain-containing protein n=1 Tax=Acrocarpospora catenulata TaxID=2836182 RepID=UPI001BDB6C0D|nr:HEPN domain-containing protein [Acrocarpospora catenulata]